MAHAFLAISACRSHVGFNLLPRPLSSRLTTLTSWRLTSWRLRTATSTPPDNNEEPDNNEDIHEVLAHLRKGKGKAKGKGNIEETSALPSSSSSSALPSALGDPAEGKGKASGGPAELIEVWHDVGPAYEDLYEALGGPAEGKGKASGGTAEGKGKSKAKGATGVITGKGPAQAKGKGKAQGQGSVVPAHWICVGGSKNGKSKGKNKDK